MNDFKNCKVENVIDVEGNPSGGTVLGVGLNIEWQNGPLGRDTDRKEPNGTFVETVISAVVKRIEFFQTATNGKFKLLDARDGSYVDYFSWIVDTRSEVPGF